MNLYEYQKWTKETAIYPEKKKFEYVILGLTSEVGELAGVWKKWLRDKTLVTDDVKKELGDCFWYLVRICDEFGLNAEDILEANRQKLEDRKARNVLKGSGDNR